MKDRNIDELNYDLLVDLISLSGIDYLTPVNFKLRTME